MKWLLLIFSIYVLALSAVPCCGDDVCCQEEQELAEGAPNKTHDSHHKPELPCSPFFSCNTCHGVIIPEIVKPAPPAIPLSGNSYNGYTLHPLPEFTATVWQPPQLS